MTGYVRLSDKLLYTTVTCGERGREQREDQEICEWNEPTTGIRISKVEEHAHLSPPQDSNMHLLCRARVHALIML